MCANDGSPDAAIVDATVDHAEAAAAKPPIGAACAQDSDCPNGAFCLTSTGNLLFGGNSAVGICTADCTEDTTACDAFESAVCVNVTSEEQQADASAQVARALCFERCTIGDGLETKCHNVAHVACDALDTAASTDGFCRPLCVTDSDCAPAYCDLRYGVCRDSPTTRSLPLGSACDPMASNNDCEGLCVAVSDATGICSHRCEFGDTAECIDSTDAQRTTGCLIVSSGGTLEDVGYCAPLCDGNADCAAPVEQCRAFSDDLLAQAFGRGGVCGVR